MKLDAFFLVLLYIILVLEDWRKCICHSSVCCFSYIGIGSRHRWLHRHLDLAQITPVRNLETQ